MPARLALCVCVSKKYAFPDCIARHLEKELYESTHILSWVPSRVEVKQLAQMSSRSFQLYKSFSNIGRQVTHDSRVSTRMVSGAPGQSGYHADFLSISGKKGSLQLLALSI